jgi:hypothetical protein
MILHSETHEDMLARSKLCRSQLAGDAFELQGSPASWLLQGSVVTYLLIQNNELLALYERRLAGNPVICG